MSTSSRMRGCTKKRTRFLALAEQYTKLILLQSIANLKQRVNTCSIAMPHVSNDNLHIFNWKPQTFKIVVKSNFYLIYTCESSFWLFTVLCSPTDHVLTKSQNYIGFRMQAMVIGNGAPWTPDLRLQLVTLSFGNWWNVSPRCFAGTPAKTWRHVLIRYLRWFGLRCIPSHHNADTSFSLKDGKATWQAKFNACQTPRVADAVTSVITSFHFIGGIACKCCTRKVLTSSSVTITSRCAGVSGNHGRIQGAISPSKSYESNFIRREFVQFWKQHSRYKAILTPNVLSQQCCEVMLLKSPPNLMNRIRPWWK